MKVMNKNKKKMVTTKKKKLVKKSTLVSSGNSHTACPIISIHILCGLLD